VKAASFVIVITCWSDGATAASIPKSSAMTATGFALFRCQNQTVQPRKSTQKTAATSGTSIRKLSIPSQIPNARPAAISALRTFRFMCPSLSVAIATTVRDRFAAVVGGAGDPRVGRTGDLSIG
jgi:hypothetical protein